MQLDLNSAKQQLNIPSSDRSDDAVITGYVAAAKRHIETLLNRRVFWCPKEYEARADPVDLDYLAGEEIVLAGLMLVAHWFANREAVTAESLRQTPLAFNALIEAERVNNI